MLTKKEARILAIVFVSVIVIFGGLYVLSRYGGLTPPWWRRIFEEEARYTPTGVRIPEAVFTYNGTVKEKGENYLVIHSRASNNYLEGDADIRVAFSPDTQFARYRLPRGVGEEIQIITGLEEPIGADQIALGDTVEVTSKENAVGSLAVTAKYVRVIVF